MMNGQVPDLQTVGELGMDLGVRRERERELQRKGYHLARQPTPPT